ncbi:MAG: aromatic ring-hydroxylating dioxygenase subunit alpha [Actinobacteria bacterium]|nr:aromatic ring-hydroxylating dioxygenase subunit alpha [Actinomycetota bacterium]
MESNTGNGWETVGGEYFDAADVYEQELRTVFARSWQFIGHESMVQQPGDFVSLPMGNDAIVLWRDGASGKARAYLNKCRHRGNKLCLHDRGKANSFTCSFHGWTYGTGGQLTGVPREKEAYRVPLDRDRLGLVEVPRVEAVGGMLFGNWDPAAPALREYLGEAAPLLERYVDNAGLGGLQFLPQPQKYIMPVNWKLLAENFAGDDYHFKVTHASVISLMKQNPAAALSHGLQKERRFTVATNFGTGAAHGFLELKVGPEAYEEDLAKADKLGPEAVEWVRHRHQVISDGEDDLAYAFHAGNVFPNLALIGISSALYASGFLLWIPRGPHETEIVQWAAVDRDAPDVVKRRAVMVLKDRQAAAGMVAPDDHENFERIAANVRGTVSRTVPFDYSMAAGIAEQFPDPDDADYAARWAQRGLGTLFPQVSEANQREFYRTWDSYLRGGASGAAPVTSEPHRRGQT